ncbi:MAG: PilN domain-containing protein [Nitrospirae bacterium]|nr:PilN domain-containing protein [Nitrospirota bacterium]
MAKKNLISYARHLFTSARDNLRGVTLTGSGNSIANYLEAAKGVLFYSPLDKILHTQKYLSIVLEKDSVSACVIKVSASGCTVVNRNIYGDTYPRPEELVSFISLIVEGTSASALKTILSVPKEWCVIKTVEFPVMAMENISAAIAFQIPDLTPFSTADVYYDFLILRRENGKLYTAIYAVKKQPVEPYLRALADNGLAVSSIVPASSSLTGLLPLTGNIVLINLRSRYAELIRAENGITTAVYTVKDGTDGIIKAMEGIAADSAATVVYGHDAEALAMLKAAISRHGLRDLQDLRELLPAMADTIGYEYLPAAAAVFADARRKTKCLNLLSLGMVEKKSLPMALTLILSIIFIAMFTLSLYIPIWKDEGAVAEIDKQIKALKPEYERLTALQKDTKKIDGDLAVINSMMGKRVLMLELLKELTVALPQDTWLARVVATEKDVSLEGYATNASALIGMLENSKFFKDVGTSSAAFKDARLGKERFHIKAALK